MQLELYEKKVISDRELPVQIFYNNAEGAKRLCEFHWHEHLELHYVISGTGRFLINQREFLAEQGDLTVVNSNELHSCEALNGPFRACVMIFDQSDLSRELSDRHILFQQQIRQDPAVEQLISSAMGEWEAQKPGYKQMCRSLILQLYVYLTRNYVNQMLQEKDSIRRNRDLERLNAVLVYIEQHYTESISNRQLADLIHLSEDRFCHLFREGIGIAPLQYINDTRLQKAFSLLQTPHFSVTEVADAVGFQDYNHFGRLFRRKYGCTPNEIRKGKQSNSGIV